ncbi:MAG: DMT family transporter [Treponemataceae bacterium]|nr:DMT family transporter [Treponemataceae bacterium]
MKKLVGIPALVLCALLWSTGGVLVKLVPWNAFAISAVRSIIGGVFMCLWVRKLPNFVIRSEEDSRIDRKATVNLWLGGLMYALTMIFYVLGNKLTAAVNVIVLEYTSPIYIILFAPLLTKEKNRPSDYFTALGVMGGMVLFFSEGMETGNLAGNILGMLSGVTYGFATIFMRRQGSEDSINSFLISHVIAATVCLPVAISLGFTDPAAAVLSEGSSFSAGTSFWIAIAGIVLLGIFQVGFPSILYSRGLIGVRALTASFVSMIEPLMNPIWVMLLVGEVPSLRSIGGSVIILGCILLRSAIQSRESEQR